MNILRVIQEILSRNPGWTMTFSHDECGHIRVDFRTESGLVRHFGMDSGYFDIDGWEKELVEGFLITERGLIKQATAELSQ